MRRLKNISIRTKQTLIIMLTSSVMLLLACAAFVTYDMVAFRRELVENVAVLAAAVGNNCAAAIDFNDPKSARETLSALRANGNIVSACVYSRDDQVFAIYQREDAALFVPPARLRNASMEFTSDELHLFRPITQRGEFIGTIFVASDLKAGSAKLTRSISIVGFVFLGSLLLAFLLSRQLQRLISGPILHLLRTAHTVAAEKNYALRAVKQSNDELGQLVDGFNEMLEQIQNRDTSLQTARDHLEIRVEERTRELAYQSDLLETLMNRSPDSIFFKDLQSRFVKVSRAEVASLLRISQSYYRAANPIDGNNSLPPHLASVEEFEKFVIGKSDADVYGRDRAEIFGRDEEEIMRTGNPIIGKTEKTVCPDGHVIWLLTTKMPWLDQDGNIMGTFGISKSIIDLKEAELKIEAAHEQLMEASRLGGMAEVATNVLHNFGNVLNSVNISASLVTGHLKNSKVSSLEKVVALLREHESDLETFITSDPRGQKLSAYLAQLSAHLIGEQAATLKELDSLRENIEHIKEIVAMQQSFAKVSGVRETVDVRALVEDSLRMNASSLGRHGVELVREFEDVPPIEVEKHKVLQILVNLLRNAKHACDDSGRTDKRVTLRVANGDGRIRISVADNGVGIPAENLTRIFSHGFTTRKGGHGFGLHSGALAAKEMDGALTVHSDGPGQGSTFTLELPCQAQEGAYE